MRSLMLAAAVVAIVVPIYGQGQAQTHNVQVTFDDRGRDAAKALESARAPIRDQGELEGHSFLRSVRHQQDWKYRSKDNADYRVPAAQSSSPAAADCNRCE